MTNVTIYNENCFETLNRLSTENTKVNIIVTSPPYNTSRLTQTEAAMKNYDQRYDIHLDNMTDEEYYEWTINLFNSFDKVLEKNGVILYNLSYGSEKSDTMWNAVEAIRKTNFMVADTIIWKKNSALPNNVSPNKLTRITEFVFVICRKDEYKTFQCNKKVTSTSKTGQKYYENKFNFIEAPNNDGTCKLNKATYSSKLVLDLLNIYATQNDIVYDPFMGTGTTAIGCMKYNGGDNYILCIGSELSAAQVEYSIQRIAKFNKDKE